MLLVLRAAQQHSSRWATACRCLDGILLPGLHASRRRAAAAAPPATPALVSKADLMTDTPAFTRPIFYGETPVPAPRRWTRGLKRGKSVIAGSENCTLFCKNQHCLACWTPSLPHLRVPSGLSSPFASLLQETMVGSSHLHRAIHRLISSSYISSHLAHPAPWQRGPPPSSSGMWMEQLQYLRGVVTASGACGELAW